MQNILIVGKPNSGKSLLFNRLTGLAQKVANFPGVTVEFKSAAYKDSDLIDFPGVYSLSPVTEDEKVTIDKLHESLHKKETRAILCNLDATRLERSLVFGLQAQHLAKDHDSPFIFILNMMDEVEKYKHIIDTKKLAKELGSPVIAISAKTKKGIDHLEAEIDNILANPNDYIPRECEPSARKQHQKAQVLGSAFAPNRDQVLKRQNLLDKFFLNSWIGGPIFFLMMAILFQSIFTWAAPFMDMTEEAIAWLGQMTSNRLPDGIFKDFVNDAIFAGLGSFLVFVPQIAVLTFIIGLLEDSGYLARAAIICHKPLSLFGLSGKSFIPYLSGFACAIPAMMAARTIESRKKRLITLLTIPLMACSARLPVYALLIAVLVPSTAIWGGFFSYQGLAFFSLYFFGLVLALIISALISKWTKIGGEDNPFIIELPPYRLPHLKPLLQRSLNAAKTFVTKAGLIIFTVSVIVWTLGYFPNGGEDLASSWLGSLGKWINPIFEPLGVDWRYGVAILLSFLAREVFVGTLGTLYGIEGADENIASLSDKIAAEGMALGTGIGLLVFYAVALQCVSTVAVLKKETNSHKAAWLTLLAYTVLAYVLAVIARLIFS